MAEKAITNSNTVSLSNKLQEFIADTGIYTVGNNKDYVVDNLSDLVTKWVQELSSKQKREAADGGCGAHVRVFGGHGLGIFTQESDMDLVAIVPKFVQRAEFFTSFLSHLYKDPDVRNIRVIAEAYVPIISFVYKDTEVDLCLCVTRYDVIYTDFDVLSDGILKGIDELSVRSLSGVREVAVLLSLIPDVDVFRNTLKVIKLWAKRRGLHQYPLGFLGGIAWAVLVAKICQLCTGADSFTMISKFFRTFLQWSWSEPVLLRPLQENTLNFPQWNPKVSSSDARHVMAVVTPAYPEHNGTFTASESNMRILQAELARGSEIIDRIEQGKDSWENLFVPLDIEKQYKHYLVVSAHATGEEQLRDWGGLVESRIRLLVHNLEAQAAVSLVHPYTVSKYSVHNSGSQAMYTRRWLLGLELSSRPGTHLSLAPEITAFTDTVRKLAVERSLYKKGMTMDVQHVKRKQVADHFR